MSSQSQKGSRVIIIDDDRGLLSVMEATLLSAGMPAPTLIANSLDAMEVIRAGEFSVALIDLIMPNLNGLELLQQIKTEFPALECVIVTAVDEIASAVKAIHLGAFDYLVKPLDSEKLTLAIANALERHTLKKGVALLQAKPSFDELKNREAFKTIIATDEVMARVFHLAEAVAETDYSVVISGETGTGKELLARVVHGLSNRSAGPFVGVNMAAFSRTLFEDSFFGHDKGAFTGALTDRNGLLQSAEEGSLFLDEITEMELELQVKLLRVIQEREYIRVGSTQVRTFNVRFIAATNRNIDEEIRSGRLREDLYYRLNMFHIHMPPLRERPRDILPLAEHFQREHVSKSTKQYRPIEKDLEQALLLHSWPGNVRELENVIARAIINSSSDTLTLSSVDEMLSRSHPETKDSNEAPLVSLETVEKKHIRQVLDYVDGNRTRAAKILGIDLRTLQRKLKRF